MSGKRIKISTKDGIVKLDIPGEGEYCNQELDKIISELQNFIPDERIQRTPHEKDEVEVNVV